MREFAGRKLRSITTQDIQRFLAGIDREEVSARTVNIHRQLLHSIFELLALRWSDVDFKAGALIISRAMSAGEESSTKSRRPRTVPLAEQAATELQGLRERPRFTSHTDFVFCRPDGAPLDRSAVRSRFIRAQEQAGVRVRRFHDLRHTFGSLAIQQFDLVLVKDMMGHSKLTTTERYLHSKPRPNDVAKTVPRSSDEATGAVMRGLSVGR
jgi:integrase